ncbi:MAG: TolB family protein [Thermoleophilia bacterium]
MKRIKAASHDCRRNTLHKRGFFLLLFISALSLASALPAIISASTSSSAAKAAFSDSNYGVFYTASLAAGGGSSSGSSNLSSVSAFGEHVAFISTGRDFGTQDRWDDSDVYIRNTRDNTISLISVGGYNDIDSSGSALSYYPSPPAISADGRYVAFEFDGALGSRDTNGVFAIFLRDTWRRETTLISASSREPTISSDGSFVAFRSSANNLISMDTNGVDDIFLKNIFTGAVTCVYTDCTGVQGDKWSYQPSLSADGRYVAFMSMATNLVPGDTNGKNDIFIKDTQSGSTSRVTTVAGSEPNGNSYNPDISANGRYVVFRSTATNLIQGDSNGVDDIFVKDMITGITSLASASQTGDMADQKSIGRPQISDDGRYVTFESKASNLTAGDINEKSDVFLKDITSGEIIIVSLGHDKSRGNGDSKNPSLSPDGNFVSFDSYSNNLMPGDTNGLSDVFLASTHVVGPKVSITSPSKEEWHASDSLTIEADLIDTGSGLDLTTTSLLLDGIEQPGCNIESSHISCQVSGLTHGVHPFVLTVEDLSGNQGFGYSSVNIDLVAPQLTKILPSTEWITWRSVSVRIDLRDRESGVDWSSATCAIDDALISNGYAKNGYYQFGSSNLQEGQHSYRLSISDMVGNSSVVEGSFFVDTIPPDFNNTQPQGQIDGPEYTISADLFEEGSGISKAGYLLIVNGVIVKDGINITDDKFTYHGSGFGEQSVHLKVFDVAGNMEIIEWEFTVTTDRISYFPWYDSLFGKTWVLMAQPSMGSEAAAANFFDVFLRPLQSQSTVKMNKNGAINVAAGQTQFLINNGTMGGPVSVVAGDPGLISERSLFGNSFEEVWGTTYDELDYHYWWPVYDGYSEGMKNWVLISNPPENNVDVTARVAIHVPEELGNDITLYSHAIKPGETWTPQFPGVRSGPVEVTAWSSAGGVNKPQKVITSQRVLYNGAFNEMPGIAASDLASSYVWTWYDSKSPGAKNWVLIANPDPLKSVYVWAGVGSDDSGGEGGPLPEDFMRIGPNETISMRNDSLDPDGPVLVMGCFDLNACENTPAPIIASQRLIWGPSFSEIAGTPEADLVPYSNSNWTWYDQLTAGAKNWVLVSNLNEFQIYAEIRIEGVRVWDGTIDPLHNVTPTFAGKMGGPVEVEAWVSDIDPLTKQQKKDEPALVFASQRVLWNGYFNEIVGKGL